MFFCVAILMQAAPPGTGPNQHLDLHKHLQGMRVCGVLPRLHRQVHFTCVLMLPRLEARADQNLPEHRSVSCDQDASNSAHSGSKLD